MSPTQPPRDGLPDPIFRTEGQPTLQQLVDYFIERLTDVQVIRRFHQAQSDATAYGQTIAEGVKYAVSDALPDLVKKYTTQTEDKIADVVGALCAALVSHLIGISVPTPRTRDGAHDPGQSNVGAAVAALILRLAEGQTGEVTPDDAGAKKLLTASAHIAIFGWFEGVIVELLQSLGGITHPISAIAELGHDIVDTVGLNRLLRIALRPLIQHTIATPLDWKVSKAARPKLLSENQVARQWWRNRWDWPDVVEELSRLGYSDARQDAVLDETRKYATPADAWIYSQYARSSGHLRSYDGIPVEGGGGGHERSPYQEASAYGEAAGWDPSDLSVVFGAEAAKLIRAHEQTMADDAIASYARREIDTLEFLTTIDRVVTPAADQVQFKGIGELRRAVTRSQMTHAEVRECVKALIVPVSYYRAWLEYHGYPLDQALNLELLIEFEMNKSADLVRLRHQKETEAAHRRDQAATDRKKRQDAIEARRQLAQLGPLGELRRAAIRGLIPLSRVTALLSAQYAPDTVAIYVADIAAQKAAYEAQQAKAAEVKKTAGVHHINVGQLDQAVIDGVLTLAQFRQQLDNLHFAPADADILTATLGDRVHAIDAAKQKHHEVTTRAKAKHINLAQFESLVIRGAQTLDAYRALLASLGYDETSQAELVELLQLRVNQAHRVRQVKATHQATVKDRGLTLAQLERGVVLGTATIDQLTAYLVANHFTPDAQVELLAMVRQQADDAAAARARRAAADERRLAPALSLSTLARAARLGVVSLDHYQAALAAAGYSEADIQIELALLQAEIAARQHGKKKAVAADGTPVDHDTSLAEVAQAVKLGERHLTDYQARAQERGYDPESVTLLVEILGDELATTQAAAARRAALTAPGDPKATPAGILADAVRTGRASLSAYHDGLVSLGIDPVDADLLTALLAEETAGVPPG